MQQQEKDQYSSKEKVKNFEKYCQTCSIHDHILVPTLQANLLGENLAGKRCLDMGCGYGNSTQWLADLNPSELIGVDLSSKMIELANERFSVNDKVKFICRDCTQTLEDLGQFDVVFSAYMLNHASSKSMLESFARTMCGATRSLCIALVPSPFMKDFSKLGKYGLEKLGEHDGEKLVVRVRFFDGHANEGKFLTEVVDYQYEPEVYVNAFIKAGFDRFEWVVPKIDERFDDSNGFYSEYLETNPFLFIKATKS